MNPTFSTNPQRKPSPDHPSSTPSTKIQTQLAISPRKSTLSRRLLPTLSAQESRALWTRRIAIQVQATIPHSKSFPFSLAARTKKKPFSAAAPGSKDSLARNLQGWEIISSMRTNSRSMSLSTALARRTDIRSKRALRDVTINSLSSRLPEAVLCPARYKGEVSIRKIGRNFPHFQDYSRLISQISPKSIAAVS